MLGLAICFFTAGIMLFGSWLGLRGSASDWTVPLCLALSLAFIALGMILFVWDMSRRRTIRDFAPRTRAQERDTELLIEIRENAGWLKERLLRHPFDEPAAFDYSRRMQKLEDLRGLVSHHVTIIAAMQEFSRAAGVFWTFKDSTDNHEEYKEYQGRLVSAHKNLIEEIQRTI